MGYARWARRFFYRMTRQVVYKVGKKSFVQKLFLEWMDIVNEHRITLEERTLISQFESCGLGVGIWGRVHITGANHIELGDNVHIGENAFIRAEGGLSIGDNTHISRNLVLYTINHDYSGNRLPYDDQLIRKPVKIGRNVWIGMNVCITPGTVIGDGAIVGMGTTVSGNVPPLSIIGSQKWRILGRRDEKHYQLLDEMKAYGGASGRPFQGNLVVSPE